MDDGTISRNPQGRNPTNQVQHGAYGASRELLVGCRRMRFAAPQVSQDRGWPHAQNKVVGRWNHWFWLTCIPFFGQKQSILTETTRFLTWNARCISNSKCNVAETSTFELLKWFERTFNGAAILMFWTCFGLHDFRWRILVVHF